MTVYCPFCKYFLLDCDPDPCDYEKPCEAFEDKTNET